MNSITRYVTLIKCVMYKVLCKAKEVISRPVYIMDPKVGLWKMTFLHCPTSMVQFLRKNQFTMSLGPSIGVNRMWTKMIVYVSKNECDD